MKKVIGLLALLFLCLTAAALAADTVAPEAPPSPRPGTFVLHLDQRIVLIDQTTSGPGVTPPEGSGFINGSPASPLTPYDTFSSAPLTPGVAGVAQLLLAPTYVGRRFDVAATLGAGYVRGSTTNAAYWSGALLPGLSPHLGAQALPYRVVFPTQAGQDDGAAARASLLSFSVSARDGSLALRGGWFDLQQTERFVFAPPALTNVTPAIGLATTESLGGGAPTLDWWTPDSPALPLHGVDLVARHALGTLELTDAALPALPGTSARLTAASLVIDHGEGTRWSAQMAHVVTGGDLVSTTVLFGGDAQLLPTPQGNLPLSQIGGQRESVFGVRAAFHVARALSGVVELARSTYAADHVAQPGTGKPGGYAHAGLVHTFGRASLALDWYRNEPYYATVILPYGAPENVWSVAWSWPGQWLKSNYQMIDNSVANVNRQGYRVGYALSGGPLELALSAARFAQIDPITTAAAATTGFVDGFYLPQDPAAATLGRQQQFALWAAWHARFGDVTLDYVDDTMHRAAVARAPADAVSYDAPELALTLAHHFNARFLAATSLARYAMRGSFAQGAATNVDFAQRVAVAGLQYREGAHTATLVEFRRSAFAGLPIAGGGLSPNFTGSLLIVEQRIRY
ncbi:hypothetical protein EPN52_12630 [bacterium]|nr:MAG: hypothetical protein EPN52_12630 [bacterium]